MRGPINNRPVAGVYLMEGLSLNPKMEAGMKKTAILLTALALLLPTWGRAGAAGDEKVLVEKINAGVARLLDKSLPGEECVKGIPMLVEAVEMAAAGEKEMAAFRGEIHAALEIMRAGRPLDDVSGGKLRKAYALLEPKKPFQMPTGVGNVEEIVDLCRKKVDFALGRIKAGSPAEAAKPVLEVILMVITPVHQ
jgi:hypothetical protein